MSGDRGCPEGQRLERHLHARCCEKEYHEKRQRPVPGALAMGPAAASRQTGVMPAALEVHELAEILGERCCTLQGLQYADRRSGPKYMVQSYLVRDSFVEPAQDDDPKDWTGLDARSPGGYVLGRRG
jgi:hypothetical protein